MANLFRMDSAPVRVLNRVADLVLLNLIFLITCLPVFTIGASVTALYTVVLRMVRKEEGALAGGYFRAWRAGFRQATALWGVELGMWAVLWLVRRACVRLPGPGQAAALLVLALLSLVAGTSTLFVFPILARFQGSVRQILANSLLIPLSGLPSALAAAAIVVGPVLLAALSPRFFLVWFYLLALGGLALTAYGSAFFLNRLFAPFETPDLPKEESV